MESSKNAFLINGGYPLHTFEELEELYSNYIFSSSDKKQIRDAYNLVLEKHKNQLRKSGEPYYHHLIEVAYIVASLQGGPQTIIAALLHDIVEDTEVTTEDIAKQFGDDVAQLVDSLTKIQRLKLSKIKAEEFEAEDHRKIFIGMAKDIRVIIIKLADRLHNLRTLSSLSTDRQLAISKESLEVFSPIAHRLGLDVIKSEMEDLCLKYLEPEKYNEISKLMIKKQKSLTKSLESLKKKIADIIFEKNIPFEISARVKSIKSIYNKMYIKNKSFSEIYDLLALRVITDTESHCYEILGLIHKTYTPLPGRFKDYIAMPKPNMYQSLHTTIISGDGNMYEVQIRTKEMDDIAESGVAAHWAYKEGSGYNSKEEQKEIENKLHWFRDFVSMSSEENSNASEYIDNLTHDIFESNVYVFTPKGKVMELPTNSTPVDFAYKIHSKIGDSTVGAIVNKIMVPLDTKLKTGDVVEIKTSKNQIGPSEGWLDFVQTAQAKTCIRKFISKKNAELLREEKIQKGKQSLTDAFFDKGIKEDEIINYIDNKKLLEHFEVENIDELYIAISNRKPTSNAVIDFLHIKKEIEIPNNSKNDKKSNQNNCPVYVKGTDNIAINLANCCTPIPGDEIVGYITKGKGISVHRKLCPNVANENERIIDVYWKSNLENLTYPVDIIIESNDRKNLLTDFLFCCSSNKTTCINLHAHANTNNLTCTIAATILVTDANRLQDLFNIFKNIKGVIEVERVIH